MLENEQLLRRTKNRSAFFGSGSINSGSHLVQDYDTVPPVPAPATVLGSGRRLNTKTVLPR